MALTFTLRPDKWDPLRNGWDVSALAIPGATVQELLVNGRYQHRDNWEQTEDVLRWRGEPRPDDESVLIVVRLDQSRVTQADHEERLLIMRNEHEHKLVSARNDHEQKILVARQVHEAAISTAANEHGLKLAEQRRIGAVSRRRWQVVAAAASTLLSAVTGVATYLIQERTSDAELNERLTALGCPTAEGQNTQQRLGSCAHIIAQNKGLSDIKASVESALSEAECTQEGTLPERLETCLSAKSAERRTADEEAERKARFIKASLADEAKARTHASQE